MDYLGDKLTVAQSHVTQWMGTVRRSFQEALNLVTSVLVRGDADTEEEKPRMEVEVRARQLRARSHRGLHREGEKASTGPGVGPGLVGSGSRV